MAFSISDSAAGGGLMPGLVSYFGLDHVTQKASNAKFTIDGKEKTSMSNTVVLNRDLSLTFNKKDKARSDHQPGDRRGTGHWRACEFLEKLQCTFEFDTQRAARQPPLLPSANDLTHILSTDIEELSRSGIQRNEDFTLSIDSKTIKKPETMQHLKTLFEEPDGLFAKLSRKMSDISLNPVDYVDKVIVTYPNTARAGFTNPYLTSIYSGMMFNSYC